MKPDVQNPADHSPALSPQGKFLSFVRRKETLWAAAVLSVLFFTVYFRVYYLTGPNFIQSFQIHRMAKVMARNGVAQQLTSRLPAQFLQLPEGRREQLVNELVAKTIKEQKEQFNYSVWMLEQELMQSFRKTYSPDYFPDPDDYYYLKLTENLKDYGALGPETKGGLFFNPLRRAPYGNWDRISWHPYAGYYLYRIISFFKPQISLAHAAGLLPVAVMLLAVGAWFLYARTVRTGTFAAWIGGFILVLAPIIIQRSIYGWYDTDPYIILFSVLIITCYTAVFRHPKYFWLFALLAGLAAGVYSLFWHGWNSILPIVGASAVAMAVFDLWREKSLKRNPALYFIVLFPLAASAASLLFLGKSAFLWSMNSVAAFVSETQTRTFEAWPNLMVLIGETNTVSPLRWIYLTGGFISCFLVFMGTVPAGLVLWRRKDMVRFRQWAAVFVIFAGMFAVSFDAERFTFLVTVPFALISVYGIEIVREALGKAAAGIQKRLPKVMRRISPAAVAGSLIVLAFLPLQFWAAHLSATKTPRVMNEIWKDALTDLKAKTPPDTIVFSWWSPGYLINEFADRRVVFDGGTQHLQEHLWMAKFFMTADEAEAVGILRMLSLSGNEATRFLAGKGWHLDDAVDAISEIVKMSRAGAAEKLKDRLDPASIEKLLDMTHGKGKLPPSAVLVYDSLMDKNIMLQIIGNWNFDRAEKVLAERRASGVGFFSRDKVRDYARRMFKIANGFLRYEADVPAVKRSGNTLVFQNSLVVDLDKRQAFAPAVGEGKVKLDPVPLYYKDGDKWAFQPAPDSPRNFVVFLDRKGGVFTANLFQKEILSSLLFRLYYFRGEGLKYLKPVVTYGSEEKDTFVLAYMIDWEAFLKDREPPAAASAALPSPETSSKG